MDQLENPVVAIENYENYEKIKERQSMLYGEKKLTDSSLRLWAGEITARIICRQGQPKHKTTLQSSKNNKQHLHT